MGGLETLTSPWQTQGKWLGYQETGGEEGGTKKKKVWCCEAATLC